MVVNHRLIASSTLVLLFLPCGAYAWGPGGHQQVADIAFTQLTDNTKKKLQTILFAGDPAFRPHDLSTEELRNAFRHGATFPDEIKSNHSTIYESIVDDENTRFPFPVNTDENEKVRCKTWHYFDTPIPSSASQPPNTGESDALSALTTVRDELRSLSSENKSPTTQAWDVYWIEHIVGDLHQPLHCATSFAINSDGDGGGNKFHLGIKRNGKPMSLHSFWDGGIDQAGSEDVNGDFEAVTEAWTDKTQFPGIQPSVSDVNNQDITSWIADGAHLAQTVVYADIAPAGKPNDNYITRMNTTCEKQALLGGYRLAKMLNDVLDH